ncbi:response regulator [Bacillus lacus]|uniref:histidine kinase n=1 Tax=Metabacillus lacus TaxID=1983721 RepID=A0A7X2J0C5_9BACI|nr:response regulator [Metabacillus lacus]
MNHYIKKSLARSFGLLALLIILLFSSVSFAFIWYQNAITAHYESVNDELNRKEHLVSDLEYSFNAAVSEFRAYFAYGSNGENRFYLTKGLEQQQNVLNNMEQLEVIAVNSADTLFLQDVKSFYQYYFNEIVPDSVDRFEAGDLEYVTEVAVKGNVSNNIRAFQNSLRQYRDTLENQLDRNYENYTDTTFISQLSFMITLGILLISLVVFVRILLRRIGGPLKELTAAAGSIANGEDFRLTEESTREDELGLLHNAFVKMGKSINEKEQDLSAQNEELFAQQDELQAQQAELEEVLEMMRERETQLKLRNELVHGISNTLNKQKILSSIIQTMSGIVKADRGMIATMDGKKDYAVFGISPAGAKQFLDHLEEGPVQRLLETKEAFTIKRRSEPGEKAYHEDEQQSEDLYIPVISSNQTVEAVMLFTRYSLPFQEQDIKEYSSLAKNASISLDKIKIFEQSEAERTMVQDILNTINEGVQLVDRNGRLIQVNEKVRTLVNSWNGAAINGQAYEEWTADLLASVSEPESLKAFLDSGVLSEDGAASENIVYRLESGKVIQVYSEPLFREGQKIGMVLVHRDITREYEVDQMKSEFVSTVSHELRTPLASVLGFTELMLHRELKPERQKKYLTTIYQEAKRLTSLINDFLDVQRMEAGKQTYEKRYYDVVPILNEVIDAQNVNASSHRIRLKEETSLTQVLGDSDKLRQVFNNLISNAVKYSPDGGEILISIFEKDGSLYINIADEGLGIPEESLDKLFTKFYRVDNSDRRRIGGTGLGLAIVKEIVKAHGGDISVYSKLGEGSTFSVTFPLVLQSFSAEEEAQEAEKTGANVVIVEDDSNLAKLLQTELEESGFLVKTYSSGKQALAAIGTEMPEAIVLDIMLQDHNLTGWEIIKYLKAASVTSSIPIFISSALDEKEKGLALGAEGYLIKPYQPSKLSKLIVQTLLNKDRDGQILIPSK